MIFFIFYILVWLSHFNYEQVPALVLDCEPNIDFSKDIEAKSQ